MKLKILCFVIATSISLPLVASPVYRYVDADGRVSYTDRRPHEGYVKLVKTWKGWKKAPKYGNFKQNFKMYRPYVEKVAAEYKIAPELVKAVIHAESYFNTNAISSKGAVGLMQLMPGTAERYGVYDRHDPLQNIRGGIKYLHDLLEMFDHELSLALAAYNAGENAVIRYQQQIPPYPETQQYVKKVLGLYRQYEAGKY